MRQTARTRQYIAVRGCGEGGLTSVDFGRLALDLHDVVVAGEDDDDHEAADERAPALVREDVCKHRTAFPNARAVGSD